MKHLLSILTIMLFAFAANAQYVAKDSVQVARVGDVTVVGSVTDTWKIYTFKDTLKNGSQAFKAAPVDASDLKAYITPCRDTLYRSNDTIFFKNIDCTTFYVVDQGGVDDGTYNHIIISAGGTVYTLADNSVSTAKLQDAAVTMAKIAQSGATSGQVLKWNGAAWAPANDDVGAGGDITSLNGETGSVQTFSSPNSTVSISSGSNNHAFDIADQGATSGQVMKYNGTKFAPGSDVTAFNTSLTATGVLNHTIVDNTAAAWTVSATGKSNIFSIRSTNGVEGIDINGDLKVSSLPGTAAGVLGLDATNKLAAVALGSGLSFLGGILSNSGDTNAADDITGTGAAGLIPYFSAAQVVTSSANLGYDGTTLEIAGSNGDALLDVGGIAFTESASGAFMTFENGIALSPINQARSGWVSHQFYGSLGNILRFDYHPDTINFKFEPGKRPPSVFHNQGSLYSDIDDGKLYYHNGTEYVDLTASGGSLPSGTSGQTLRHNGTSYISSSFLQNTGTYISIGSPLNTSAPFNIETISNAEAISISRTANATARGKLYWNNGLNIETTSGGHINISPNGTPTLRLTGGTMGFGSGTPALTIDFDEVTDGMIIPKGTTAQRGTPVTGQFRTNTTQSQPEIYDGSDFYSVGKKSFGEFYLSSTSDAMTASTGYGVITGTSIFTEGELLQFTHSNGNLYYQGSIDKKFKADCHGTVTLSDAAQTFTFAMQDNGATVTKTEITGKCEANSTPETFSLGGIVTLSNSEAFRVAWKTSGTSGTVTVSKLNCTLTQLN